MNINKLQFLISFFLIFISLKADATRSMYVDDFASILGNPIAENELLAYAQTNGIETILLYELHLVNANIDLPNPATNFVLANFISKAKNDYGILKVGASGENGDFITNVIDAYNNSRSNPLEKFDIYNLEFEYWQVSATGPNGYYCTTYLEPNGLPCTVDGAFQFYISVLQTMTTLADNNVHPITTEAYVGWPSTSEAATIGANVDRVRVHAYVSDPSTAFNYSKDRLIDFANGNPGINISLLFSAEPNFMQTWLLNNSMLAAENIFASDWLLQSAIWTNNINLEGFTYFTYTDMTNISLGQNFCDRSGISNGWMLNMNDTEVNQITNAAAATGAQYFRADFAWSDVQWNSATTWNWENIDRVVNSATAENLEMIAILDYFPPWADVNTDTSFWYNYVYQAGLRYIPQGVVVWEMWNEPNITNFWPDPNVVDYVEKILKPGSNAIRKAAADLNIPITVLTGGLAPAATDGTNISQLDFVTGIYENGGANYFDGLGQHPYCWPLDPSIPSTYNWFLNTQQLRNVMVANFDGAKKIWGTEMGWPTHFGGVTEAEQASYLTSAYSIWNDWSWTGPLIWYAYNDAGSDITDPEDNFGLVDVDFIPKPAYYSFLNVIDLCESTMPTPVDVVVGNSCISLYPNPVADKFTIEGLVDDYDIQILDSQGNIFQEFLNSSGLIEINIQSLPAGIYFILIQQKDLNEVTLKKILKY